MRPLPPTINPPVPPGTTSLDDLKRRKLSIADLAAICQGAYPLDYLSSIAIDTITFDAVPEGVKRVLVIAEGSDGGAGSMLSIYLIRQGEYHLIASPKFVDGAGSAGSNASVMKSMVLISGDVISMDDDNGVGANVYGTIGFLDVFI